MNVYTLRDVERAGDDYSRMQITNQVNQVQQVHIEMRQKVKELTYIIELQKTEIRLYS